MSWFWRKEDPKVKREKELLGEHAATPEEIMQTLRVKRMQLLQQHNQLESHAKRAMQNGDRQTAITLMQQKELLSTRLQQMDGQLRNMEQQQIARDSAATSAQMARTMRNNVQDMEILVNAVDVDDIHEVADSLSELHDQSFEMSNALSKPMGTKFKAYDTDDKIAAQLEAWSNEKEKTQTSVKTETTNEQTDNELLRRLEQLRISPKTTRKDGDKIQQL